MVSLAVMVIACVALAVAASSNEAIADSTITHPGAPIIPPGVPAIVISERSKRTN